MEKESLSVDVAVPVVPSSLLPSCECRGLNHPVFFASWAIARILYTHTQHVYPETEDVAPIERLFRWEAQFSRLT